MEFLERRWHRGKKEFCRAEKLYTAHNYQAFLKAFKKNFPQYVYYCPKRGKQIISVPLCLVKQIYVPRERLFSLIKQKKKDQLQKMTLRFIRLVSAESGIPFRDFGVHGAVALNMHTSRSDIDIVVYGSLNFRLLENAIGRLVESGTLTYLFNNRLDAARRFRGRYQGRIFMYNAVRKPEEIANRYEQYRYKPVERTEFVCTIKDDSEAMFRPAIYRIEHCKPTNHVRELSTRVTPESVVSMIGCYRNIARKGDRIKVHGMLEKVEDTETGQSSYQVVVGTGVNEEESICPI